MSENSEVTNLVEIEKLINRRFDQQDERFDALDDQLHQRNNTVLKLKHENRELHRRVRTLEERLLALENQVNHVENNSRKNNIEVEGIPDSVKDTQLRSVTAEILNHVSTSDITVPDIECAHRLNSKSSPKSTIVRLKRNFIDEMKNGVSSGNETVHQRPPISQHENSFLQREDAKT